MKQGDEVEPYQTVFIVYCSPDFLTPGFRESQNEQRCMIIESQEEGTVSELKSEILGEWVDVGTAIGIIDDGDETDGDWTWQAYTYDDPKPTV